MWNWLIAAVSAAATVGVTAFVLIKTEQEAPFNEKPSIVLRSVSGDLPSSDLPKMLEEQEAANAAIAADIEKTREAARQHRAAGVQLSGAYTQLQTRIEQQQATVWAIPYSAR